jgi:hypothetical protein
MALTLLEEKIDDVETEIERRRHSDVAKPGSRRRSSDLQTRLLVRNEPGNGPVPVEDDDRLAALNLS